MPTRYKSEKLKNEERAKVLQVLNALGGPVSIHEIVDHPLLKGILSTRMAGQYLKYLSAQKEVRFKGNKMWAPIQKRELPAKQQRKKKQKVEAAEAPAGMFFVLNPTTQTVMLDVGGLRLPVIIED
jgi:hypothetical protein